MSSYKDRLRIILGLSEQEKLTAEEKQVLFSKILASQLKGRKQKIIQTAIRVAAALTLFSGLGVGLYLLKHSNTPHPQNGTNLSAAAIVSEGYGAILTLSDGSTIDLANQQATLKEEINEGIAMSSDSLLRYESPAGSTDKASKMNTLEVPRKYTFQVILADGTKVWLNADSKLRYPTRFSGTARQVELTGEAYFEVASNKEKPFIVRTDKQQIQVLGTHFNVYSYPHKPIITSLLEGKVAVHSLANNKSKILLPGDQSSITSQGDIEVKHVKNIADFIAWKDGYFQLNGTPITEVMDILSRWYDFEYTTGSAQLNAVKLYGKIHKSATLDQALQILHQLDIHYSINKNPSGQIEISLKNK